MIVMKLYFFVSSRAICFLKNHIVAICGGWIFYCNLNYVIPLSEESLNTCVSHGQEGIAFDGFFEQIQIGLKE